MAIFVYISTIVLGLLFKKSKICTAYILSIMYIFSAFRITSADYENYKIAYNSIETTSYYKYAGYTSFQKVFHNIGLSFEQYNIVFYIIVLLLFAVAIRILTKNVNSVLAYYMIFSFPIDAVQMKSYLSEALSLVAISIIIKYIKFDEDKKLNAKQLVIALGCFIMALYIHFSSAFYLIAAILYFTTKNRNSISKKVFALTITFSLVCYSGFFAVILKIANNLGIVGRLDYLDMYTIKTGKLGFILYAGWIILLIFACRYNKNEVCMETGQSEISSFMLTSILIIPFLILNVEYNRLIRIYMILLYIFYSNIKKKTIISKKILFNYSAYFFSIIFSYCYIVVNLYEGTLGALLKYNSIIK